MTCYVAEYDENSCVWLIDILTKQRIPLQHGMILAITEIIPPAYILTEEETPHA